MAKQNGANVPVKDPQRYGIAALNVRGFKSLWGETHIETRPLTILAGANSSGKTSVMQPLLLLKQTLEAPYDPGPLLLDGPNVRFTSTKQMFSTASNTSTAEWIEIGLDLSDSRRVTSRYRLGEPSGIRLMETRYDGGVTDCTFRDGMSGSEIMDQLEPRLGPWLRSPSDREQIEFRVARNRCFLVAEAGLTMTFAYADEFIAVIHSIIHVRGLRGNPARTYKTTAVGDAYAGTFENYVASVIHQWQDLGDDRPHDLGRQMDALQLGGAVTAHPIDDTQVELRVARLVGRDRDRAIGDTVSIADVGFGVSQSLPVIVALLAAKPEQLVFIEQPEIHLHPRAQFAMAKVLADAANRGVRVVAETHSSLLLMGVQAAVAEGYLAPELVKLHWFQRDDDGATHVTSADLDADGAFGEWPEDFGLVELEAESRYLDLVEARRLSR